jgi:hypothetical protein
MPLPVLQPLFWRQLASFWRGVLPGAPAANFEALDFSQAVATVLTTFGVLVAVSIADFFDETKNKLPEGVRLWALLILLALLLRYIIGSAIHLNRTYNPPAADYDHSPSTWMFLKDIGFLIAFGVVAIRITRAPTFFHFFQQSALFVGISLLWSITDAVIHGLGWASHEKPFYLIWMPIDAAQLLLTLLIYACLNEPHLVAKVLTVVYMLFFFGDLVLMIRVNALK